VFVNIPFGSFWFKKWDPFFMRENRPDDRQLRELAERVLTPDLPIEPHNFRPPHWSYLPHPSKHTLRNRFPIVRRCLRPQPNRCHAADSMVNRSVSAGAPRINERTVLTADHEPRSIFNVTGIRELIRPCLSFLAVIQLNHDCLPHI